VNSGDTIAAISTAPGRGGVAVVRVSGPDAFTVGCAVTGRVDLTPGRIHYGKFYDGDTVIDDGIVLVFKAPGSYTGEDTVEFQGHGGTAAPARVLKACLAAGARLARKGEFTLRAFLNGKLDYEQSEAVIDLIDAKTERAADAALSGMAGAKKSRLRSLYDAAVDLSSSLEHALDVSEEELPAGFVGEMSSRTAALRESLSAELRQRREGRLLRDGALVVLAGPPNAGKSSLMNALLGENRAIVSDVPGTTRDSIEDWLDVEGWPVRLVDTAGLRETGDAIEGEGVARAKRLVDEAAVVLALDAAVGAPAEKVVAVHAKCDLVRGEGINVSSVTGEGLSDLRRAIAAKLEALSAAVGDDPGGDEEQAALRGAMATLDGAGDDPVLLANAVRSAATALGGLVGATYSADLLDRLFSRFCVGK